MHFNWNIITSSWNDTIFYSVEIWVYVSYSCKKKIYISNSILSRNDQTAQNIHNLCENKEPNWNNRSFAEIFYKLRKKWKYIRSLKILNNNTYIVTFWSSWTLLKCSAVPTAPSYVHFSVWSLIIFAVEYIHGMFVEDLSYDDRTRSRSETIKFVCIDQIYP